MQTKEQLSQITQRWILGIRDDIPATTAATPSNFNIPFPPPLGGGGGGPLGGTVPAGGGGGGAVDILYVYQPRISRFRKYNSRIG